MRDMLAFATSTADTGKQRDNGRSRTDGLAYMTLAWDAALAVFALVVIHNKENLEHCIIVWNYGMTEGGEWLVTTHGQPLSLFRLAMVAVALFDMLVASASAVALCMTNASDWLCTWVSWRGAIRSVVFLVWHAHALELLWASAISSALTFVVAWAHVALLERCGIKNACGRRDDNDDDTTGDPMMARTCRVVSSTCE
jgi:hypothetical protein